MIPVEKLGHCSSTITTNSSREQNQTTANVSIKRQCQKVNMWRKKSDIRDNEHLRGD